MRRVLFSRVPLSTFTDVSAPLDQLFFPPFSTANDLPEFTPSVVLCRRLKQSVLSRLSHLLPVQDLVRLLFPLFFTFSSVKSLEVFMLFYCVP